MANLLWPGDHRAGDSFSARAVAAAMVRVERVWLSVLTGAGIAPAAADGIEDACWALSDGDLSELAMAGEAAGNPAVPLVTLLRGRLPEPSATWLHRGLTSQDVLDTAVMLCAAQALDTVRSALSRHITAMTDFMTRHRATPMLARTLTQPAISSTLGVRAAAWLSCLLDAAEGLAPVRASLPAQIGGAAGTLAAVAELAHGRGLVDPAGVALRAAERTAQAIDLAVRTPWHTSRAPITRLGDALVTCTDAWGRIARDVLTGSRPEIGELREGAVAGRGGSSTMPGKNNPVLAILLRRAALAAPALAATLHLAATEANDDRPDGSWHVEWDTLALLARRTVTAADQASELVTGLVADPIAMRRNLDAHLNDGTDAEQGSMAALTGAAPADEYVGAAGLIIDRVAARAQAFLHE